MCDCIKTNKALIKSLEGANDLLRNHIFTMKVYKKLGRNLDRNHFCELYLPCELFKLIKKLFTDNTLRYSDILKINNKVHCDCADKGNFKIMPVYCDPETLKVENLCRTDIIFVYKCLDDDELQRHYDMTIAKYEGFINFFEKVIDILKVYEPKKKDN